MAAKKTTAEPEYPKKGLTGPADTDDPGVRVSSSPPKPSESDHRSGSTSAATAVTPAVPPLQRIDEPRIEVYDVVAPDGTIVEVTHDLDNGGMSHRRTGRQAPRPSA